MAKKYATTNQKSPFDSWDKTQKAQTYKAIAAAGADGIDRESICTNTNLPKQRVWFYLSELRRGGLIKRLGEAVDPTTLDPDEAALHALSALENALVIRATKKGITPDMRDGFNKYQKIKAIALRATIAGEADAALRQAVLMLVRLIF